MNIQNFYIYENGKKVKVVESLSLAELFVTLKYRCEQIETTIGCEKTYKSVDDNIFINIKKR